MCFNRFDHLRINAQHRVQRHHRVLEDHGDAVAPQIAHFFFGKLRQIAPLKQDGPAGDAPGWVNQANDGKPRDGFAGTGFANKPHHLAAADGKGNAIHRLHHASAREEICL